MLGLLLSAVQTAMNRYGWLVFLIVSTIWITMIQPIPYWVNCDYSYFYMVKLLHEGGAILYHHPAYPIMHIQEIVYSLADGDIEKFFTFHKLFLLILNIFAISAVRWSLPEEYRKWLFLIVSPLFIWPTYYMHVETNVTASYAFFILGCCIAATIPLVSGRKLSWRIVLFGSVAFAFAASNKLVYLVHYFTYLLLLLTVTQEIKIRQRVYWMLLSLAFFSVVFAVLLSPYYGHIWWLITYYTNFSNTTAPLYEKTWLILNQVYRLSIFLLPTIIAGLIFGGLIVLGRIKTSSKEKHFLVRVQTGILLLCFSFFLFRIYSALPLFERIDSLHLMHRLFRNLFPSSFFLALIFYQFSSQHVTEKFINRLQLCAFIFVATTAIQMVFHRELSIIDLEKRSAITNHIDSLSKQMDKRIAIWSREPDHPHIFHYWDNFRYCRSEFDDHLFNKFNNTCYFNLRYITSYIPQKAIKNQGLVKPTSSDPSRLWKYFTGLSHRFFPLDESIFSKSEKIISGGDLERDIGAIIAPQAEWDTLPEGIFDQFIIYLHSKSLQPSVERKVISGQVWTTIYLHKK